MQNNTTYCVCTSYKNKTAENKGKAIPKFKTVAGSSESSVGWSSLDGSSLGWGTFVFQVGWAHKGFIFPGILEMLFLKVLL